MILTAGQILVERYRIVGLLGQGGMASVYCAHDRVLDRLVAVKQLRPDPTANPRSIEQVREQFQREAQILATLAHPNLPRVTDYFSADGEEYLVMDYVEGQALNEIIERRGGGLDEAQVLDWGDQLLGALDYIHQHGVIHRDVKPSNVRLTPEGRIMLVDFGLLKLYDPNNLKTATVMHGLGTPEYAPPEQYDARAGHTDPRSDVYSAGATLYHLLTGQAPSTATQRVADPRSFRPPRLAGANISDDLERVILRAMELQVTHRFGTVADMRSMLAMIRQQLSVDASHTRRLPKWAGPAPRALSRRFAPLAVFALLVVGGVIGLASGAAPAGTLTPTPTLTPAAGSTIPPTAAGIATTGATALEPSATLTPRATPTPRAARTTGASPTRSSSLLPAGTLRSPTSTASSTLPRSLTPTPTPTATATREPREAPSNTPTRAPTSTDTPAPTATATGLPTLPPETPDPTGAVIVSPTATEESTPIPTP